MAMRKEEISAVTIEGVNCYIDANGTVMLNLKNCVIGLGLTQTKNGVEYVRWDRVRDYLRQINFSPVVGKTYDDAFKESFIPEPYFYMLAMKADSPEARAFQHKVAFEILPAIRKHGAYMTPDTIKKALSDPDFIIDLATRLKAEQEKTARLTAQVKVMAPKSAYCDAILRCPDLVPVTAIAKDYGLSALFLNRLLHELGIQYRIGKMWVLYQPYASKGYTKTQTFLNDGNAYQHTYWTQTGRLFLYEVLKENGYLPTIEHRP